MQLRPFQNKFVSDIRAAFGRTDAVLACGPTGCGKTVVMAHITRLMVANRHRVLIACHRDNLIEQTSEKLHAFDIPHGMIGGGRNMGLYHPVIVGTIQSVVNRKFSGITALMFDEAHLSKAASWLKVREQYASARLLGLSATPTRLDGSGFDDMYGELVMGPSVAELMDAGFLTRYRAFAPSVPDLTGVHNVGGDFNQGELAGAMQESRLVGNIVQNWKQTASDRLSLLFAVNRTHSERMAAEFRANGIEADFIDGSMSKLERKAIMRRFGRTTRVLCSVGLFTEGFDRPDIECLILARPTQSLALHLQMIGRGLRIHPGKSDCIIMDHAGNILRHGFPDDDRDWTLKAKKRRGKKSADEELPPDQLPRVCPKCMAVCRPTAKICACGYQFAVIVRKPIEETEGELKEILDKRTYSFADYTAAAGSDANDAGVARIIQNAAARGWKPGAVWMQKRALFEARDKYRAALGGEPKPHWNVPTLNSIVEIESKRRA
jgi:superfamily II DNA or RNA helicase